MLIAIHGRFVREGQSVLIQKAVDFLLLKGSDLLFFAPFRDQLLASGIEVGEHKVYNDAQDVASADFLLSFGGDGTVLDSLTYVQDSETPILGINTGRMGFLTALQGEADLLDSLDKLVNGIFQIEKRALVGVELEAGGEIEAPFALNECAVLKTDSSSMISVKTYLNDSYLNTFWADGLIVSTPTGSTGYNLSCGGPIVYPQTRNLIITPVCPHNLNVRPLVVPDSAKLRLEVESRADQFMLSLDSRSYQIPDKSTLKVQRAAFEANLIKFQESAFEKTIRAKLHWGLDNRN